MTILNNCNFIEQKIGVKVAIRATFYTLITIILLSIFISIAMYFAGIPKGEIYENLKDFSFILYLTCFLVLIFYLRSRTRKAFSFLGFDKQNIRKAVLWGFVWGILVATLSLLSVRFNFSFSRVASNLRALILHPIGNSYYWFMIAIGPLLEETIARGLWYNVIREKMPKILAILLISFLLTLIHTHSSLYFYVGTFLFQLVMTLLFEKMRNIYSPLIAHVLHNSITFFFLAKQL